MLAPVYKNESVCAKATSLAAIQEALLRECNQLVAHINACEMLTRSNFDGQVIEDDWFQGMMQLIDIQQYRVPLIAKDLRLIKKNLLKDSHK